MERIVACWGVYDGTIHKGHIHFLKSAKRRGDKLFVFVAPDSYIVKIKFRRPIFNQKQRMAHLLKTKIPDKVIANSDDWNKNIQSIINLHPYAWCFSRGQTSHGNVGQKLKSQLLKTDTKIYFIKRFKPELYSTTKEISLVKHSKYH